MILYFLRILCSFSCTSAPIYISLMVTIEALSHILIPTLLAILFCCAKGRAKSEEPGN